jgi:hypothetical protein
MGIIGGMNRGPKFPPRARRAGARLALTDPDQIEIRGNIQIQIIVSDHTDTTDLPVSPDDGQMVLLIEGASISVRLCVAYGGEWHEEVLSEMS